MMKADVLSDIPYVAAVEVTEKEKKETLHLVQASRHLHAGSSV